MRSKTIIRAGALLAIFVVPWQGLAQERGANASETSSGNSAIAKALETEAYLTPPNLIADFINAPRHKNHTLSNLSPDGSKFLISESSGMTGVDQMGKAWHNLAGIQIDPAANRSRSLTTGTGIGFTLLDWKTEKRISIEVPKDARVGSPVWSPDGSKIAYLVHRENASYLAVADTASGKSKVFDRNPLLATQVTRPEWSADGKSLFAVYVPEKRGPEPKRNGIATQPLVRIAESGSNRTRTYRNLLENANDQVVLEYFLTGQLAKVDAGSGRLTNIGEPRMYRSIDPAPSGMHVRVTTTMKPFSYVVPASSFGSLEEVVDLTGKPLIEIAKRPL
ncbi:MAG TPA: hypothetical protein PLX06_13710, partial [Fimbriimonadaceae bacterium]|nr:hypothetical protein [Fimbriimonadaceae bacterium]